MRAAVIAIVAAALLAACASADEFRAFWVDAWGSGFLNQAQVDKLLGVVGDPNSKGDIRNANCNAVIVQVRRRADVCYPSGMGEPYFSGLSPSNFNALQAMINAAHDTTGGKQRIEVHCWIVAFATSTASGTPAPLYYAHNDPSDPANYWVTLDSNGNETSDRAMDPGHPNFEEYLVNVCMDLVNNFDIDGIHYDYIRFTGSTQGYNPTSVARYNARYGLTGQPASTDERWKQWRRDQVTAFVRKVYAKIQSSKPHVKQSGAFVTWNPSPTSSTRSAFQATRPYYEVYSDWDSWVEEGIVDFAVPMTYYNLGGSYAADYTRWMNFEKDRKCNRHMVVGPGIYLNSLANAIEEIKMTRYASPAGNYAHGFCGYSYRVPYSGGNWADFSAQLVSQVTPTPANIPLMPWKASPTKGHISGTVTYFPSGAWADGASVSITGPESRSQLCDGTGFYAFIDLTPGTYTITVSMSGYAPVQRLVNVTVGSVTGNMFVNDFALGGEGPPVISNVQASAMTTSAATISWTTDQASSSRVEYGPTTNYGSLTPLDSTPVTSHTVNLSGLASNTLCHYRVISANAHGTSYSADHTFTTSGPPSILSVQATNVTATSASITWTTNAPADGGVNYGTTTAYGSQASDPSIGITHTVSLSGLVPNATCHYQCISTNAYGTAVSTDYTFTTLPPLTEIVIDNTDAGWTNTSPNGNLWTVGSLAAVPKIGSNYLYRSGDGSTIESSVTRKCRWTPNLSVAGTYDVYVFYQIGANRNSAAPFTVHYSGGQITSIQNQYSTVANQGGWFRVGQDLPFAAGTSGYVECTTLTNDTNLVSADAAKWVLKSDATPPVIWSVYDDTYTTSTTTLQASWTGSDPESGIQRFEFAVGLQPGGTSVKGWTDAGTATSAAIGGLSLVIGSTYYVTVRAVNGSGVVSAPMSSPGVTVARAVETIAQAKSFPDGEPVALPELGVSACFASRFYVEEADRSSGLRVESAESVAPSQLVQLSGVLETVGGERALTQCKVTGNSMGPLVQPVAMAAWMVGGSALNGYTPGVTGGMGPNNVGLLVRLAGRITAVTADGFHLDDGSSLSDDSGYAGLRIWTGSPPSVVVDTWVCVTGAVSCRTGAGGVIYPQILARDIRVL